MDPEGKSQVIHPGPVPWLASAHEIPSQPSSLSEHSHDHLSQVLNIAVHTIHRRFPETKVALFLVERGRRTNQAEDSTCVLSASVGELAAAAPHEPRQESGAGAVEQAAQTGRTVWVNDVAQSLNAGGSELALPILGMTSEAVIGVLDLRVGDPYTFEPADVRALETIADQLGIVIENARRHVEVQRHLQELSVVYHLARQMNTSLNIHEVLDAVVWSLKQAMNCRGCSIALLDPVENVLEIRTSAGVENQWVRDFKLRLGEGIAGRVAQEGQPLYVPDVQELDEFIVFDPAVRSLLTVPLTLQQRVIGTLSVDSDQPNAFGMEDERLLTIAATQAAIAIENARLYAGLEQRAQNLAEAYAELKKADRVKDEVVQNVSHELRMPLTFVKSYVELLLDGDAGPLTEEQRAYLEIVSQKTNLVTKLVSDIMMLQQAEQLPAKREAIELGTLIHQSVQGCTAAARETRVDLVAHVPDDLPLIAGDAERLQQVFDNLLGNAIKFSPNGGQVVVAAQDIGPVVQVSVADQGIGIPRDQQGRIFERFYQIDGSIRRRFGGSGLGLAIVKQIVEAHNGRIWVESEPGLGSTFYFTIPKYSDVRWGPDLVLPE
jgi:signal transduction histidine kinase